MVTMKQQTLCRRTDYQYIGQDTKKARGCDDAMETMVVVYANGYILLWLYIAVIIIWFLVVIITRSGLWRYDVILRMPCLLHCRHCLVQ